MKKNLLFILPVLALLFASCNKGNSEEALLREVIHTSYNNQSFTETSGDGQLIFTNAEGNFSLIGTYRHSGKYLVLNIEETNDMDTRHLTGIFIDDNGWTPLFRNNLIFGKLDTIVDLNGDQVDEVILNEYNGGSAGFTSVHELFAKGYSNEYERIADLYKESEGSMKFLYDRAAVQYVQGETGIAIVVDTEHSDTENWSGRLDDAPPVRRSHVTLRWQPPDLIQEEAMGDMSVPGDGQSEESPLDEAQSMIDMLNDYRRKNELLAIKYYMTSPSKGVHNDLYFDGYLSELTFRDYEMTAEGGVEDVMHLEFLNNAVVRGTKRIAGEYDEGILTYVKDWQTVTIATELQSVADNLQEETPIADPPGGHINASDVYYTFDPAKDEHIAFIRAHAAEFKPGVLFSPGPSYIYDVDGTQYAVDSVLWVREFLNK